MTSSSVWLCGNVLDDLEAGRYIIIMITPPLLLQVRTFRDRWTIASCVTCLAFESILAGYLYCVHSRVLSWAPPEAANTDNVDALAKQRALVYTTPAYTLKYLHWEDMQHLRVHPAMTLNKIQKRSQLRAETKQHHPDNETAI